jgi:glutaminyl-peptide cyclotransferase
MPVASGQWPVAGERLGRSSPATGIRAQRASGICFLAGLALAACGPASQAGVPEYTYDVVHTYPHDPRAFTEGLFYLDGFLYESTGIPKQSSIRKVRLETGEVLQQYDLPEPYFGEGIVNWKDRLIQLTYTTHVGFVYDLAGLRVQRQFQYSGEGWALTTDGKRIFMSDGTAQIRIWEPETLRETGRITVTERMDLGQPDLGQPDLGSGRPVQYVNELEWVKGEIYANIYMTNRIARINPANGNVIGWIDLTGLLPAADRAGTDWLNGIAYDARGDRLFVTGKLWPKLFEIRLLKKSSPR